jgi:hypothetical protein
MQLSNIIVNEQNTMEKFPTTGREEHISAVALQPQQSTLHFIRRSNNYNFFLIPRVVAYVRKQKSLETSRVFPHIDKSSAAIYISRILWNILTKQQRTLSSTAMLLVMCCAVPTGFNHGR